MRSFKERLRDGTLIEGPIIGCLGSSAFALYEIFTGHGETYTLLYMPAGMVVGGILAASIYSGIEGTKYLGRSIGRCYNNVFRR